MNIITKPHKMHFSHSYKGLGKCTFLKLCTMHLCTGRTIVHWTVTARMEACTFLKTPALTTLPPVDCPARVILILIQPFKHPVPSGFWIHGSMDQWINGATRRLIFKLNNIHVWIMWVYEDRFNWKAFIPCSTWLFVWTCVTKLNVHYWHGTHDMCNVTCRVGWISSQNFSSLALTVC